tara:strand:- start:1488 stop:2105 length:618 start_codon:yes stop_codon:yes gene_type:complete
MEGGVFKYMIRVGIIGKIASGKSFIAKLFNSPVFNADREVNFLYKNSRQCFKKLKKILPNYIKSFPIKKSEIISAINNEKKNLKKVSSVVHPMVRKQLKTFIRKNKNRKLVILDIPLLIENNLNMENDVLVFVKCNRNKILERLKKRPNYNKKILKSLSQNQIINSKKLRMANYIIDNNFSPHIMKNKIILLKKKILNERNNIRH